MVFYAEMLASMKMKLRFDFEEYAREHRRQTGETANCYIQTTMGVSTALAPKWGRGVSRFEKLPDIILTNQLFSILSQPLLSQIRESGEWEVLPRPPRHPAYADAGLDDDCREFYILASCPYVFLIDLTQLGSLPEPRTWSDILDPVYEGKICINGTGYGPDPAILLFIYRRYGMEGLERLKSNLLNAMHGSAMARNAGTLKNGGAAVYLSTAFFAYAHGESDVCRINWPKDGAAFQPCTLLVRKGSLEKYKWIVDYVLGERFGKILDHNRFPPTDPAFSRRLSEGQTLDWCGWEILKDPSAPQLISSLREMFAPFQRRRGDRRELPRDRERGAYV